GAAGDHRRQVEGLAVGSHQQVRRGLARRVRAVGGERRGLTERRIGGAERAIDFVRADVEKAERAGPCGQLGAARLEQRERARDEQTGGGEGGHRTGPSYSGRSGRSSESGGYARSFSDKSGCCSGQSIAIAESFHTMPCSSSGA